MRAGSDRAVLLSFSFVFLCVLDAGEQNYSEHVLDDLYFC